VRYQIVIVFMIAAAAALGAFGIVYFAYHRLFDQHHRLRLDRVRKVSS
jgi:putative ABC transport system permease protein